MAEPTPLEDTLPDEETEFQKILAQIGGKEKIHLVSDVGKSKEDDDAGVLQEFIRDVFCQTSFLNGQPHSSLPHNHCDSVNERHTCSKTGTSQTCAIPLTVRPKAAEALTNPIEEVKKVAQNDSNQKTVIRRTSMYSTKRTIDSPVIIFLFRQKFMSCQANLLRLKEILKDVKARTKRATIAQPALIGLIRTTLESPETNHCARILEDMIRSVFHRHAADTVWVGTFIPKTEEKILQIKTNACRAIYASRTPDNTRHRGNPFLWPFQCLLGPHRRAPRGQANNSTCNRGRGDPAITEEGIPLKTKRESGGALAEEESTVKGS